MNDDDYWIDALKNHVYRSTYDNDWSWTVNQAKQMDSSLTTQQIYDFLKEVDVYSRKDADMAYTYSRGSWYQDTRGDEVATATLEAYSRGVDFDTLLKKNTQVRLYWKQVLADKEHKEKQRIRDQDRLRKLAEKRAQEKAKREEVMTKLSQEELEAFGLTKKGKKK